MTASVRLDLEDELAKNLTAINAVLDDIEQIKLQIRKWDSRRQLGKAVDRVWFHGARRAMQDKQIEHRRLMARQTELKRQLTEEKVKEEAVQRATFDRAFRDVAKASLPPETYAELTEAAKRLMARDLSQEE